MRSVAYSVLTAKAVINYEYNQSEVELRRYAWDQAINFRILGGGEFVGKII